MTAFRSPRLWLIVWGGLGALFLVYVIIAASVQTSSRRAPSALHHDSALLTGEMADFQYALSPSSAPEVPFLDGEKEVTLADFRGKAVLVNFWATWCPPCVKELPSLDALETSLGGDDFQVVAIAADARGTAVTGEFLNRHKIDNLERYADPRLRLIMAVGGADSLPVSILYDRRGREIGRISGGADWNSAEAKRLIQTVINSKE